MCFGSRMKMKGIAIVQRPYMQEVEPREVLVAHLIFESTALTVRVPSFHPVSCFHTHFVTTSRLLRFKGEIARRTVPCKAEEG